MMRVVIARMMQLINTPTTMPSGSRDSPLRAGRRNFKDKDHPDTLYIDNKRVCAPCVGSYVLLALPVFCLAPLDLRGNPARFHMYLNTVELLCLRKNRLSGLSQGAPP